MTKRKDDFIDQSRVILNDNVRVYNPDIARYLGSINAAIVLQQCRYWSQRTNNRDGWIYKTIKEFETELVMSRYQQDRAIKILINEGVIEKKRGYLAKRYLRVIDIKEFLKKVDLWIKNNPNCTRRAIRTAQNQPIDYKDFSNITSKIHTTAITLDKKNMDQKDSIPIKSRAREWLDYFNQRLKAKGWIENNFKLTYRRKYLVKARLKEGNTIEDLIRCVDNFVSDNWEDRCEFVDPMYCIGVVRGVDMCEKWLNYDRRVHNSWTRI